jgi:hypothetical protein
MLDNAIVNSLASDALRFAPYAMTLEHHEEKWNSVLQHQPRQKMLTKFIERRRIGQETN